MKRKMGISSILQKKEKKGKNQEKNAFLCQSQKRNIKSINKNNDKKVIKLSVRALHCTLIHNIEQRALKYRKKEEKNERRQNCLNMSFF